MTEPAQPGGWITRVLGEQRRRWREGDRTRAEAYLRTYPQSPIDPNAALDIIYQEFVLREQSGEKPTLAEYLARFPAYEGQLRRQFALHEILDEESIVETKHTTPPVKAIAAPPPPRPVAEPATAVKQFGGYEIEEELEQDELGIVYRAHDPWQRRTVALKVLADAGRHDGRRRLLSDVRTMASLQHPNVVQVFLAGEAEGRSFLVLEYVDGPSLATRLGRGPLETNEAARVVAAVARGVQALHERGMVHRDLRPGKILFAQAGDAGSGSNGQGLTPKIAGQGLAWHTPAKGAVAKAGTLGTPNYLAPEHASGAAEAVGPTGDVYALGAILYECLTGRPPFCAASRQEVLSLVMTHDPVAPRRLLPSLPRDLDTICLKCLHKQPHRRYASAAVLADELDRFLAGKPVWARPLGRLEELKRWARREPRSAALAGGLAVAGLVAIAILGVLLFANGLRVR